jgi:hypothetical protein
MGMGERFGSLPERSAYGYRFKIEACKIETADQVPSAITLIQACPKRDRRGNTFSWRYRDATWLVISLCC